MRKLILIWVVLKTVSYGFPTLEDGTTSPDVCPADSVLVNGTCECDHTLCKKPQCHGPLTLATNSSGTPGKCCPIYTCDLCTLESMAAGTCMCAVGALLNIGGVCECTDSDKSLLDGVCVCDERKCPPESACDENSIAVKKTSECCESHVCTKCPEDSYPAHYNDDEIEDKCVCFPCASKECPNNKTINVVQRGTNFPRNCCDVFVCDYQNCTVEGVAVPHGEIIYLNEGISVCQNGVVIHQQAKEIEYTPELNCLWGENVYVNGAKWSDDECTNCTCNDGNVQCKAGHCKEPEIETITPKPKCKAFKCEKDCPHGYKTNKDGCLACKCIQKTPEVPFEFEFFELRRIMHQKNLTEDDVIRKIDDHERCFNFGLICISALAIGVIAGFLISVLSNYYCSDCVKRHTQNMEKRKLKISKCHSENKPLKKAALDY